MIGAPIAERFPRREPSIDVQLRADLARERGLADLSARAPMDVAIRAWGSAKLGRSYTPPRAHRRGARQRARTVSTAGVAQTIERTR
jgi:hypothetical protein